MPAMWSMPGASRRIASRGRSIDELLQAQLEQRQRRPRDDQVDLGQVEQRRVAASGAVEHAKAADRRASDSSRPSRSSARRSRPAGRAARDSVADQRVAVGVDARKHDEAHGEQRQREQREARRRRRSPAMRARRRSARASDAPGREEEARAEGIMERLVAHCSGYPTRARPPVTATPPDAMRRMTRDFRTRRRPRVQPLCDAGARRASGRARLARRRPSTRRLRRDAPRELAGRACRCRRRRAALARALRALRRRVVSAHARARPHGAAPTSPRSAAT